jgi:hypothetical protein
LGAIVRLAKIHMVNLRQALRIRKKRNSHQAMDARHPLQTVTAKVKLLVSARQAERDEEVCHGATVYPARPAKTADFESVGKLCPVNGFPFFIHNSTLNNDTWCVNKALANG